MSDKTEPEMTPQTRSMLDLAIKTIKSREQMYGQAVVTFVFERASEGRLLVCYGLVTFLRKKEDPVVPFCYEYEQLVFLRTTMGIDDTIALLRRMYEHHTVEITGLPPVPFLGTLYEHRFLEGRYDYGYSTSDWPRVYITGSIEQGTAGKITQDPLVSLKYPLYPDGVEALRASAGLRLPEDAYSINARIEIIVPDYRAKITGLVLEGTHATVEVQLGEAGPDELVAKFYSRGRHGVHVSENLPLSIDHVAFDIGESPLIVEAHLLSAQDGSTIDKTGYNYRYPLTRAGVVLKDEEVRLLDIISRGENETVEFKRWLERNDPDELAETVVAFANTKGGMIILGVTDRSEVEGVLGAVDADRIHGWVTEFCDPPISVGYRTVNLQEKTVVVLDVPEGNNRPYVLKDRGPYVRRGATDRAAKRVEIDEFYRQKRGMW